MTPSERIEKLRDLVDCESAKSAVESLHRLIEDDRQLRRVLRAHWEDPGGIREEHELRMRDGLDWELFRLELLEVAAETGYLSDGDVVQEVSQEMRELLETDAVQRFVDAYFYFGTRFLLCRIKRVEARVRQETKQAAPPPLPARREQNVRPMSLPCPPAVWRQDFLQHRVVTGSNEWVRRQERDEWEHVMDYFAAEHASLWKDSDYEAAVKFLDDFVPRDGSKAPGNEVYALKPEQRHYLLWLRGLMPGADESSQSRFETYTRGMVKLIRGRAAIFREFKSSAVQARIGLLTFYILAKLMRAEVSPQGEVTFAGRTWIDDLQEKLPEENFAEDREILCRVFSLTCDLIQESVQIAQGEDGAPGATAYPGESALAWRFVFDDELDEIRKQRRERILDEPEAVETPPPAPPRTASNEANCFEGAEWSRRASQSGAPLTLTGIAFSGGGIRSATFNLGVLEGLRSLDFLRKLDYLSTVSGGGYIGAWLAANVKRTPFWLSKGTSWAESIQHLRKYSNYLAPEVGILSADTWTMVGIWMRNTTLIQLTVFATILCVLLGVRGLKLFFDWWPEKGNPWFAIGLLVLAMFGIGINLFQMSGAPEALKWFRYGQTKTQWMIVIPLWAMSLMAGAKMWHWSKQYNFLIRAEYSQILGYAWQEWWVYLLAGLVCLWGLGLLTLTGSWWRRIGFGLLISAGSMASMYVALCGIMRMFHGWTWQGVPFGWMAFVWTPPLLLVTFAVTIVLFLGLLSRQSLEWTREWWTRLGAWFTAYGAGALVFSLVTVYGPMLVMALMRMDNAKFLAGVGWVLTTAAGLAAGGGPQTKGDDGKAGMRVLALDAVAKLASVAFIGGVLVLLSAGLQNFFAAVTGRDIPGTGAEYWSAFDAVPAWLILSSLIGMCLLTSLFAWRFDINIFSLNSFYRNRLVRCYLGATRWAPRMRKPQSFTGFDEQDDMPLQDLRVDGGGSTYRGPFPIVNCAVNLGGSSDLALHTRHSAAFALTPLYCGTDRKRIGYVPTQQGGFTYAGIGSPTLGKAIAISGAAANPNMGYHTSPLVAFLMTLFNVRLGWWLPNPGRESRQKASPLFSLRYLLTELFGMAGEKSLFVNVSDGGHFENLGVYELVRRRCKVIIAADSECDDRLMFEGLGNLIRICEVDFGTKIRINVDSLRRDPETGWSKSHGAVGVIEYSNGSFGYLIYLKATMTGDEDPAVRQYQAAHKSFPHETTGDQFFTEDQFESYRRLGAHVAERVFRDVAKHADLAKAAAVLGDLWTPAANPVRASIDHTTGIEEFWEKFRGNPSLADLQRELYGTPTPPGSPLSADEFASCAELIQLMENAYLELRLDDHWDHPDNLGWQKRFLCWARSHKLRVVWNDTSKLHGVRFRHFCDNKLGLPW